MSPKCLLASVPSPFPPPNWRLRTGEGRLQSQPFLPVLSSPPPDQPILQRVNRQCTRGKCQRRGTGSGCGRPVCVAETAVLGTGQRGKKALKALNRVKRFSGVFSLPLLPFVLSEPISLPTLSQEADGPPLLGREEGAKKKGWLLAYLNPPQCAAPPQSSFAGFFWRPCHRWAGGIGG
jgi:hypothetical protein